MAVILIGDLLAPRRQELTQHPDRKTPAETVVENRLFAPPRYAPDDVFPDSEPLAGGLYIQDVGDSPNAFATI